MNLGVTNFITIYAFLFNLSYNHIRAILEIATLNHNPYILLESAGIRTSN